MKVQSSKFKVQKCGNFIMLLLLLCVPALAAEKWEGVDTTVVEKYSQEHGRDAGKPLINTDQGDLLLFAFLIAGAVGGFAAGYYWRVLMTDKPQKAEGEGRQPGT